MWEYHLYAAAQSFCYTPNPPLQYLILNAWNISNSIKYCGTMYAAALYFLKPLQYLIHRYVELSNSIKYCGMTGGKTLRISLVLLESTKNKQGFYQNKTTLYEERKRNEAPRRKKLTGFSPVGKAKGENPKFDLRKFVLDSWTMSSFCSRCLRTQRFILDSGSLES